MLHIETLNVTLAPGQLLPVGSALTDWIAGVSAKPASLTPPPIGQVWPGQGGIYIGVSRGDEDQPDAHLIMHADYGQNLSWEDALAWAARQTADGHTGFRAPTRFESALIYANARDQVDTDKWHWTGTQYSADDAFYQYFYYGAQYDLDKKALGCVRAVRLIQLGT